MNPKLEAALIRIGQALAHIDQATELLGHVSGPMAYSAQRCLSVALMAGRLAEDDLRKVATAAEREVTP